MANAKTRGTTFLKIASDPYFVLGIKDFTAETWGGDFIGRAPDQWSYERGRQLAAMVAVAGHDPMRLVARDMARRRADLLRKAISGGAIR